jgi:hypothetical protein
VPHDSDLIAELEALPGVDHVERLSLTAQQVAPPPAPDAFLITSGRHVVMLVGSAP